MLKVRLGRGKTGYERFGRVQAEVFANVFPNFRGGGSGKCGTERISQQLQSFSHSKVVGAEIMPPLRNAMGLIDGQKGDIDPLERIGEST